jgi:hypothetical protein
VSWPKNGDVAAFGDDNAKWLIRAFLLKVQIEPMAEPACVGSDDVVIVRIVTALSSKHSHADRLLVDLLLFSFQTALGHEQQEAD